MFDQEGGGGKPHAIMHPAGLPKLAYTGVDIGVTGFAILPRLQQFAVRFPTKFSERFIKRRVDDVREMRHQVIGKTRATRLHSKTFPHRVRDCRRRFARSAAVKSRQNVSGATGGRFYRRRPNRAGRHNRLEYNPEIPAVVCAHWLRPGFQNLRIPPAQSGCVGSSFQLSSLSPAFTFLPVRRRGTGSGAGGGGAA